MALFGVTFRELIGEGVTHELEQSYSYIGGYLLEQHNDEGGHTNVTATTLNCPEITTQEITGPVRIIDQITFDQLIVSKSGVLSPSSLSGNQNNFDPADATFPLRTLADVCVLRLDATADRQITGIAAPATVFEMTTGTPEQQQRLMVLVNRSDYTITLVHASASSTSANRFDCPGQINFSLAKRSSVWLWYDSGSAVWRILASASAPTSGTYTPTLTKVANLTGTPNAYTCQWSRINNVVTVSGKFGAEPTAANAYTQLGLSLPVASSISAAEQIGGTATGIRSTPNTEVGSIEGDATNDRALISWESQATSDHDFFFIFQYQVI